VAAKKKGSKKAAATKVKDPRAPISPTAAACTKTVDAVRAVLGRLTPPSEPGHGDLVDALLHVTFAEHLPCGYAEEVARRIEEGYVDRNEFRVTEAFQTAEPLADLGMPDTYERCLAVRSAVSEIYNDQNAVSLEFLREASITDRNHFFQRVPSVTPMMQRFLTVVLAFEECIFSDRSTQRVQVRLGFDPKLARVQQMWLDLREMLAPWGHLPLSIGASRNDGKVVTEPELCVACLLQRLAPAGKK